MGNRNSSPPDRLYLSHLTRNPRSQAILQNIYRNNSNPPVQIGTGVLGGVDLEVEQFPFAILDVKKTSPKKSDFMIDRRSVKLVSYFLSKIVKPSKRPTDDPTVFYLTFKFTTTKAAEISIYLRALEVVDEQCNTKYLQTDFNKYPSIEGIDFEPGQDQEFPHNLFLIDTKLFENEELSTVKDETYPLIIKMMTKQVGLIQKQEIMYIYCVLKKKENEYVVDVVRQKLEIDGRSYLLNDVYEIYPENEEGPSKKECTICLTRTVNVIVLPCRHMFLCSQCAKDLRNQNSHKCPICRKPIKTYVKIKKAEDRKQGYPENIREPYDFREA